MSDLSAYLGNKILDWLKGTTFPSAPADIYVALFDGDPKGAGTEVTLTIDASGRKVISLEALSGGTDTSVATDADVDFGLADAGADLSHVGIFDASTSGNLLWAKALPGGPYVITTSMPVKFNAAAIVFNAGGA